MTRTRRRSRASARLAASVLGALVAWLIAGTHLASSLHFVLVSHQVCAAHGELEHAASAHAGAEHAHGVADPQPAYRGADDDVEHRQCGLLGAPREELAVAPPARLSVAPAARLASPPVPATAAPAPSRADLLLVAPKQSPPV
jgi:hypothetical protein